MKTTKGILFLFLFCNLIFCSTVMCGADGKLLAGTSKVNLTPPVKEALKASLIFSLRSS